MLKMATAARVSGLTAAYSAMLTASVVLPIEGRPATMTRSPARRPPVMLVEFGEAGGQPAQLVRIVVPFIDLVDERRQQRAHRHAPRRAAEAPLRRSRRRAARPGRPGRARGFAVVVEDRGGDLACRHGSAAAAASARARCRRRRARWPRSACRARASRGRPGHPRPRACRCARAARETVTTSQGLAVAGQFADRRRRSAGGRDDRNRPRRRRRRPVPGLRIEQQAAEHRLLGFDRVRRYRRIKQGDRA